jgi:hypothetical protein
MRRDLASIALRAVVRVMGEPIIYRRRGEQWSARGEYQANPVTIDPETSIQVRSTQPALLVNGADLPVRPQQGDEVDVRGKTWQVSDSQPDGHGGWLLMLHRTSNR